MGADTSTVADEIDPTVGTGSLCTTEASRHNAVVDGDVRHFHRVLYALVVPFLHDAGTPITIQSDAPRAGHRVGIEASKGTLSVDPADAVTSSGVATDIETPERDEFDVSLAHEWFCAYTNAFPSEAVRDEWAARTDGYRGDPPASRTPDGR